MSLDYGTAIAVNSIAEEHKYIAAHPCSCKGRWQVSVQALLKGARRRHYDRVDVICRQCGQQRTFLFDISSFLPVR